MVVVVAMVVTCCHCVGWVATLAWLLAHCCFHAVVVGDRLVGQVVVGWLLSLCSDGGGCSLLLLGGRNGG